MTRIDEREQQREVREGQREIRERHLVKVADWVAAMICDATKRVREWDMERKKAETGSSGLVETDKETENGEKAEVGGGEDGMEENTGDGGQMEVDKDGEKDERTEKTVMNRGALCAPKDAFPLIFALQSSNNVCTQSGLVLLFMHFEACTLTLSHFIDITHSPFDIRPLEAQSYHFHKPIDSTSSLPLS